MIVKNALPFERWGAYTISNDTHVKSHIYCKSTIGNEFPRGGFESSEEFSSVPLSVIGTLLRARRMHAADRTGSLTPSESPIS